MNITLILLLGIAASLKGAAHEICRNVTLKPSQPTNDTGGIFEYNVTGVGMIEVFCDVKTDGGDWIVLQRRVDGAVAFDRDWTDYVKGFGNLSREFWLGILLKMLKSKSRIDFRYLTGLEVAHRITNMGNHELRIDMIEKNGTYYTAKYSSFSIASSAENYTLQLVGYSGNATDALVNTSNNLLSANNQPFSARDVRHDQGFKGRNCAGYQGGGWWFGRCSRSNLNRNFTDLAWRDYSVTKDWMFLRFVEMKFRRK